MKDLVPAKVHLKDLYSDHCYSIYSEFFFTFLLGANFSNITDGTFLACNLKLGNTLSRSKSVQKWLYADMLKRAFPSPVGRLAICRSDLSAVIAG